MVGSWLAFVVLGVLLAELVALWTLRRDLLPTFWPTIASGGAIVAALGVALEGGGLVLVGGLLALGGAVHAWDLVRRLKA